MSKTDRPLSPAVLSEVAKTIKGAPSSSPKRGFGYKPDAKDERDFSTCKLFGAIRGLPIESLELENFIPFIADQGSTSSCVGQAIGGAIDVRSRKVFGPNVPLASRMGVYTIARSLERIDRNTPLRDDGSFPRLAMKGLREWGVPSAERWPFDPANIDAEAPWDVLQEASGHKVSAWWRVYGLGKTRTEAIAQAIASGYPVVFGTQVDSDFQNFVGKSPVRRQDPEKVVGGHAMFVLGYRTDPKTGNRIFRNVNSWGTSWGDGGLFWADESFYADASDVYVLQVG